MLTGSHTHTHRLGEQSPLVFCINMVEKVRLSVTNCHTVFNQTLRRNLWNGATHPRKKKVKIMSSARKLMATDSLSDNTHLLLAKWSTKKSEISPSLCLVYPVRKILNCCSSMMMHDQHRILKNSIAAPTLQS
jgi:hypothetical protein